MTNEMKYYVNANGNYLGAANVAPQGGIEVAAPPEKASQIYANGVWSAPQYTWDEIRDMRNEKLAATDWAVLPDSPHQGSGPLLAYRQSLRDIPETYASPQDVVWPQNPLES